MPGVDASRTSVNGHAMDLTVAGMGAYSASIVGCTAALLRGETSDVRSLAMHLDSVDTETVLDGVMDGAELVAERLFVLAELLEVQVSELVAMVNGGNGTGITATVWQMGCAIAGLDLDGCRRIAEHARETTPVLREAVVCAAALLEHLFSWEAEIRKKDAGELVQRCCLVVAGES